MGTIVLPATNVAAEVGAAAGPLGEGDGVLSGGDVTGARLGEAPADPLGLGLELASAIGRDGPAPLLVGVELSSARPAPAATATTAARTIRARVVERPAMIRVAPPRRPARSIRRPRRPRPPWRAASWLGRRPW